MISPNVYCNCNNDGKTGSATPEVELIRQEYQPKDPKTQRPEVILTTTNFETVKEHEIAAYDFAKDKNLPPALKREHDGASDKKDRRPYSQAAAALRKVLSNAGKQDDAITKPAQAVISNVRTEVSSGAAGAKRYRRKGRSRAGRGRGKGSKEGS